MRNESLEEAQEHVEDTIRILRTPLDSKLDLVRISSSRADRYMLTFG